MTARNALTQAYLDEVARRGLDAQALVEAAHRNVDLQATSYEGRCLTRPVFLDRNEWTQLEDDVRHLHAALTSLPDRLFGGDLGAFARAAGMTGPQITAIVQGRGAGPTRLARADLYHDGHGFRLMEVNMGSTLGGLDNVFLVRAFLTHPVVADFVSRNGLAYVDTIAELVDTLRTECGIAPDDRPLVAIADWPASYATLEPQLRYSAAALARYGIEAVPCHVGQLAVDRGRVWLERRPVDVVYRLFMVEDLLDTEGPALIDPVLRAAESGEVKIFAPLDAELYGSKAALAMLSDEANRALHDPAQLASLDRILPWTRMARDGDVTVDGQHVDVRAFAIERREDLVLKPTLLHGGHGVVLGWQASADEWREHLKDAMGGPYVLQRRIRGEPEPFPSRNGLAQWLVNWGVFSVNRGYGGTYVRAGSDLEGGVVNVSAGATAGCCFHEE